MGSGRTKKKRAALKRVRKQIEAIIEGEFECGFCGAAVSADTTNYQLFHPLPPCRQFLELHTLDYLRASRLEHERKAGIAEKDN